MIMNNYFSEIERACPCCDLMVETPEAIQHLEMLNKAREHAGIPFIVNSWWRCEKHNREIKGSPTSSHLEGVATDIRYSGSVELYMLVDSLLHVGFNRILIYPKSEFIHVDSDSNKVQLIIKIMEQA